MCAVLTGKTGQLSHHDRCRALNRVREGLRRRHVREAHRPGVAQGYLARGYLAQVEIDRSKAKMVPVAPSKAPVPPVISTPAR